jgi:hypothetical protein
MSHPLCWQDWETETLDIDLSLVGREEELGVDLAGGRDDPASGGESPVYISAIHKVRKGEEAD